MSSKGKRLVLVGLLVLPFAIMLVVYLTSKPVLQRLPKAYTVTPASDTIYQKVPPLDFQTAGGEPYPLDVTSRKTAWIGHFLIAPCNDTCQVFLQRLRQFCRDISREAPLEVLAFSIRDSQEVAGLGMDSLQALVEETPKWQMLTGPEAGLLQLARKGFGWDIDEVSKQSPRKYRYRLVLVDPDGFVRGSYLMLDDQELKKLKNEAIVLIREIQSEHAG